MLTRLLQNHVLANLAFVLILTVGLLTYTHLMPREKDPEINFNWVNITTVYPGAAAIDVEQRVTDNLEAGIENLQDIKFVSSYSRDGISSILVRFKTIDDRIFDRRMADLRTEIQAAQRELPEDAQDPVILEITTSNAFPTASIVVTGEANDDNLRKNARIIKRELERIRGVDRVDASGLLDPELHVDFYPERLAAAGIKPTDLADTVSAWFRDLAAGKVRQGPEEWSIRVSGTDADPAYLADLPILTPQGELRLGALADVATGREKPLDLVYYRGKPAVMMAVMKQSGANTIELVDRLSAYLEQRNRRTADTGIELTLADDQTINTRRAIDTMQRNALMGLGLVLCVTWLFLGSRIALLTTIGIPFTLAGTFWVLHGLGHTLNTNVLLGIVIGLGMLVDDAVVVVESIYFRMARGVDALSAALDSLKEVTTPVITSVLTTMAAFMPLMLLPGILGEFMKVIPMVVTVALAISLLEAFWILPAHVITLGRGTGRSRLANLRRALTHGIRLHYSRWLLKALRRPRLAMLLVLMLMGTAVWAMASGKVFVNFFALESFRLFYVNVEMPPGTALDRTMAVTRKVETAIEQRLQPGEARAVVSYAGRMFTETEPLVGNHLGQIMVSLNEKTDALREVDATVDAMRPVLNDVAGPMRVWLLPIKDGPPTGKPIAIKVRGDDLEELKRARDALSALIADIPGTSDISNDASPGPRELNLRLNDDAVRRTGLDPAMLARTLRLLADGQVVAAMQNDGDELVVRVRAKPRNLVNIDTLLANTVALPGGGEIALSELVQMDTGRGLGSIRHYNFRRAITVEAELDKTQINVVDANARLQAEWQQRRDAFPTVDLDFSGELDDIQESMDAIGVLFLFGIGLIYVMLGTLFRSYFQPLMILMTVPLAFTGVVAGLVITGHPLSLFTLYGIVALAGISVNSAIVLICAANQRLEQGMGLLHATVYAARRRVIPILITALTTIAGLFSLATGLGGKSLLWGPVATAIVWGLAFSTLLTLFVVPILYRLSMVGRHRYTAASSASAAIGQIAGPDRQTP